MKSWIWSFQSFPRSDQGEPCRGPMRGIISIQRSRTCGCLKQRAGDCCLPGRVEHSNAQPAWVCVPALPHASCRIWESNLPLCAVLCHCSVTQSCPALCSPVDCSTPGLAGLHHLPELAQTHAHWVVDAIQPSCPLLAPSPPAFSLSQRCAVLIHK